MKHHTEPLPRAASRGRILSGLTRLSDRLKRAFHRSFAGYLLAGNYRSTGDGLFTRLGQRIAFRRRVSIPLKRAVSRACDRSLIRRRVESAESFGGTRRRL